MFTVEQEESLRDALPEHNNINRKKHKNNANTNKNMYWSYLDNCIRIMVTVFLADIILRFYKFIREYYWQQNYYLPEGRLLTILNRVFLYNGCTLILILVIVILGIARSCLIPPLNFLKFMPLYILFMAFNCSYSKLDYADWLRADHNLDTASSMASAYFHGYLKFTLPARDDKSGLRERIEQYENVHNVKFLTNRLVVLVPTELYTKGVIESEIWEKAQPLEMLRRNRSGISRPYQNDVYRITKPINGAYYYVVLEGATPMMTFFETLNFPLTSTWQLKMLKREILLKFYKFLRNLVRSWPETEEEIEVVIYNSYDNHGRPQDAGHVVLAHFLGEQMHNGTIH